MGMSDHLTFLLRSLYTVRTGQKQQLELDMEQWTGSKWGKEYIKAVYCLPVYLTFMQSTPCEMLGWMNHQLESRLPGEIRRSPVEGIGYPLQYSWASLVTQMVKNLPANAGGAGSIPWSGRSPGEGNGNPLQYSCLENPTDRGALWATVHGVAKSRP